MPPSPPLVDRLAFRRAPLAAAALCFALGIATARWQLLHHLFQPTPFLLAALLLLTLLSLLALARRTPIASFPVASLWLALGLAAVEWQPSPPYLAALLTYADNLSRTVEAHVVRVRPTPHTPEADEDSVPPWERTEEAPAAPTKPPLSVDLALDRIEDLTPDRSTLVPIAGGVRVAVYDPTSPPLRCGDRILLPLRLKPPQTFRDPGAFDLPTYLLTQGIAVQSSVQANRIERLTPSPPSLRCRIYAAQTWASTRILNLVDSPATHRLPPALRLKHAHAAMLNAMLFGDRAGLTHSLRVGFERTGSFHLFVVSGLHIALLAAAVFWLLRKLRTPLWLATFATIAAAAAYTALTGFGQPAQRSLVMVSVYLLARLLSRNRDSLNALGAAALALLLWSPSSLFDASFQMTILAILAIAGIAIPLGNYTFLRYASVARDVFHPRTHFEPREMQLRVTLELWGETIAELLGSRARRLPANLFRATLWACELALIAIVAELVMVLPMALYFHRAAVFALPANMVVIPLIGLLAPAAILTFVCSLVSPWLAVLPAAITAAMLHAVTWTIHRLSHLAVADVRIPGPALLIALLAVAAWLACCWLVRRSPRGALATGCALPLLAALVLWPETPSTTPATLEITALDVGQGDSLLAVNPSGQTMLIDAGGPIGRNGSSEAVSSFDIGEEVVSPYLWSRRIRRLDIVVLSHAHTDHMGGMPAILENFRPRELWVGIDPHSPLYTALLAQAARLGILVRHLHAGDRTRWGSVAVSILAPASSYTNPAAPRNDDSLVLTLQLGKASVLLEGDAEAPSEQAMLAAHLVHPVTLLKVGHHGSRTSTTQPFLDAASPTDAVISVGRHNTFGHPRPEIVERLAAAHRTRLFRTDQFGLTTFLLTPDGSIRELVDATPLPTPSPPKR